MWFLTSSSNWKVVGNTYSWVPAPDILRVGPGNLCFNKASRGCLMLQVQESLFSEEQVLWYRGGHVFSWTPIDVDDF